MIKRFKTYFSANQIIFLTISACLLCNFLMTLLSVNLDLDTQQQLIINQSPKLINITAQPPLYDWLFYATIKTLGLSLLPIALLKYILIALFVITTLFTGRIIFQRQTSSTLVIISFLLIPEYAFKVPFTLSHTILLITAISCTFLTYCLVIKNNKPLHFVLFGLAIAMGIYSKYNYIIFLSALFFTTVSLKEL